MNTIKETIALENVYQIECYGPDGRLKWVDEIHNLVTDVGLNDMLDKYLKGAAYTAAWYVGLTGASPVAAAADTMASDAGWTDVTAYSNATRPALTLGTVAAKCVDNSASKAVFNINASATLGGAFVVNNSTKGGTTGTLYGIGAFVGGDKTMGNGDTLNVTVTLTAASA